MQHHGVETASFIKGPLQPGDTLVSFYEPGIRGVGMDEAAEALRAGLGPEWRDEDITDYDERRWNLGELSVRDAVGPKDKILELIALASEIERPEVHGVTDMTRGFVPELRSLLGATCLGAEIDEPFDSKLAQLIRVRFPESSMYNAFTMAHGPIIATPKPDGLLVAAEELDHEIRAIGTVIEEPVIRIRSPRLESGELLSYDA
jgi:hypothetical protein